MTDAQSRLDAVWAEQGAAPARDVLFRARTLEGLERRLLRRRLAMVAAAGSAAIAALSVFAPQLPELKVGPELQTQLPVIAVMLAAALTVGGSAWAWRQAGRRL